jgi:putative ABC transport system permease protein
MLVSNIQIALQAIAANKLRSMLTMLGIILGVGSVIIMLAVGAGARARVREEMRMLGANVLVLQAGTVTASGARLGAGSRPTITEGDASAIQTEIPEVAAASGQVRGTAQVIAGNANWSTTVLGIVPEYFTVREWTAASGRLLDHDEVKTGRKVAVLGKTVAEKLFSGRTAVDQVIRVNKVSFTVIGVLESKGQSTGGVDQDDLLMMPIDVALNRVVGRNPSAPLTISGVVIKIHNGADMKEAAEHISDLIRRRHKIQPGQDDDFWLRNLSEVLDAREDASRTMTVLLAAVAFVSLIVGGIGIMNIMLVSVVERTREIGIRMAIGARPRDILAQFLVEAVVLSVIGGLVGLVVGFGGSAIVGTLGNLKVEIDPGAVAISLSFAALVGAFFGFYPARRAALLQPIDALRYD